MKINGASEVPMPFQNEQVSRAEAESSDFFRTARQTLRLGSPGRDQWTVDRENERVLVRTGGGHEPESIASDYWVFVDRTGRYFFETTLTGQSVISRNRIRLERTIHFIVRRPDPIPTVATFESIKDALTAYKDYGLISRCEACELVLRAHNGEVI